MTILSSTIYLQLFLKLNFIFFSFFTLLTTLLYFFFIYKVPAAKLSDNIINSLFKLLNVIAYLISFVVFLISFYLFFRLIEVSKIYFGVSSSVAYSSIYSLKIFFLKFDADLFGFVLLLLAYIVGFLSLLTLDTRLSKTNFNFFLYFNYFILFVYLYVTSNDVVLFFIFYELLLLPSFFFVYFISYSKKAIQASLYFVIWTQVGSLLVLFVILYLLSRAGSSCFFVIKHYYFFPDESALIYIFLFLGFGFKIPIWPFHYWLTKTHVEAPSGFSIYLSGFLVKSALYGFFKLSYLVFTELAVELFVFIAFLGAIDASLKMWGQSDLKKLVAYCTIQEMNLILIAFLWGDAFILVCGFFFSAVHAFLSSLMFYLVDCIYRRYHARSIYVVSGIITLFPNLGFLVFLMVVFFGGLPGTVKFVCEFYIFSTVLSSSFFSCALLMFVLNFFGLVGFSKSWFNSLFGLPSTAAPLLSLDVSKKEFLIIFFSFSFLFFSTYFFYFIL